MWWKDGTAVAEKRDCRVVFVAMKDMLHHVDIGSGWDCGAEIGGYEFAAAGEVSLCEARFCLLDRLGPVDEHTGEVGIGFEDCSDECATAAAEVGYGVVRGEVPCPGDAHVVFGWGGSHDGAKDGVSVGIAGPERRDALALHDGHGVVSGANALGEVRPAIGEEIRPEDDGRPLGVGRVFAEGLAERCQGEGSGLRLGNYAEAGESAQKPVERRWVCVTGGRQLSGGLWSVAERVCHAETRCGCEGAAASITHGHFGEAFVVYDVADGSFGFGHDGSPVGGFHDALKDAMLGRDPKGIIYFLADADCSYYRGF